ncbi:unnamed protein product [Ceutorhynchus assimilis]|uniref:Uncharacterized protein n=1 Tax=Ceutorhynchus assimilis TaxID=467358 RepID=A0A9N9MBN7_9CUCU|nr:unnamed protein product [Ceutorhynchus assimilis]
MDELHCGFCTQICFFRESKTQVFGCLCDNCQKVSCRDCSKISSQEVRCAIAETRTVLIWCRDCIEKFSEFNSADKNLNKVNSEVSANYTQLLASTNEVTKRLLNETLEEVEGRLIEKFDAMFKVVLESNKELVRFLLEKQKKERNLLEAGVDVAAPPFPPSQDKVRTRQTNVAKFSSSSFPAPVDLQVEQQQIEQEQEVQARLRTESALRQVREEGDEEDINKNKESAETEFTLVQNRKRRNVNKLINGSPNWSLFCSFDGNQSPSVSGSDILIHRCPGVNVAELSGSFDI